MNKKKSTTKPNPSDLEAVIRDAINRSELTGYALAQKSGVDAGIISRFLSGERELRLGTASKLCEVLGLKLG